MTTAAPHPTPPPMPPRRPDWWRQAVVYQIYPRSFADAERRRPRRHARHHLARAATSTALGIDAVWLSPFYPSALADGGYDVADYRDVDPRLGTLADFDELVARAARRTASGSSSTSCRTTPPTSTSGSRRRWPPAAARPRASATSSARAPGPTAQSRPTDWVSLFGGPAWERVADGQWYLHLFAVEQPDLNWAHPRRARRTSCARCGSGPTAASTGSASTSPTC